MPKYPLILGSQSKRRKEILSYFSLPFQQATSPYYEKNAVFDSDPEEFVREVALQKAEHLAPQFPKALIFTADTVVHFDSKLYLKPEDEEIAFRMLHELRGKWHEVWTGVCLKTPDHIFVETERTRVQFHDLTEKQIRTYHEAFYFKDKVGGYAIQEAGSIIVNKMEGCFYNVMGLPINATRKVLQKAGIDLWDHLKNS